MSVRLLRVRVVLCLLLLCSLGLWWISVSTRKRVSLFYKNHPASMPPGPASMPPPGPASMRPRPAIFRLAPENGNKTSEQVVSLLPEYSSIPFSPYLRKGEDEEWVFELHNYLSTLNKSVSPHVNMVFGDYKHSRLVLNWITAAVNVIQPPLHNVLVLSLDNQLCDLIASRTLPVACVAVAKNTIFNIDIINNINDKISIIWLQGSMVRNVILRVMNYWGYDVASYDSDAVLLKNPQVLYDERPHIHLFSSAGTFPFDQSGEWGFTLCTGTLMLKASPAIESLWRHISSLSEKEAHEQFTLNNALLQMNSVWLEKTPVHKMCTNEEGWEGRGEDDIRIYVFPPQVFCRAGCCKPTMSRNTLYNAHPIGSKTELGEKEAVLKRMKAWFL